MSPALIALLPFFGALLPGLMVRSGRSVAAIACGLVSLVALIGLCLHIPEILAGQVVTGQLSWLPQLGMNAEFRIDGLGLLFGILILGIGILIITYSRFYLDERDPAGQFFTYLMLFQGAMLGIVLSDNILLLLVFWELTTLSSFLLIGFWGHLPEGRQGARMSLVVTGTGGLAMIAGMLILGHLAGSFSIGDVLAARDVIQDSPLYLPALLLILLGTFSKSAQFPFHFWLPKAMAAPTPVSAYLHSATMVKAGIFLMARLWPVLSGTPEWFYLVATTGLVTMVLGAGIALFRDNLKSLLAYSTVSHLGFITMLLGFGTEAAAVVAVFHIINHATFKAALFMCVGTIDHETGTQSLSRLGGLRRLMPVTFAVTVIASLSMAGIPPLNGFITKEMMLVEAMGSDWGGNGWIIAALAVLGAMFSVAYSLRLPWAAFFGAERSDYPKPPHEAGAGLWLPPMVLVVLVIGIGLAPQWFAGWLVEASANAVTGQFTGTATAVELALWHGFNTALLLSALAILAGLVLVGIWRGLAAMVDALPEFEAKTFYDTLIRCLARLGQALGDGMANGSMSRGLSALCVAVVLAGTYAWATGEMGPANRPMLPVPPVVLAGWFLAMAAIGGMLTFHRNRILALVLVGVVGLIVALTFLYLSAPDLALTQISVEVVTVVLMLLVLYFLPKRTSIESGGPKRGRDAFIATLTGLGFGGLAYAIMRRDFSFDTISGYMIENSQDIGGGTNVVNVILVDFRGYDTFGEITVLGIAALTIFALTETLLGGRSGRTLASWLPTLHRAGDAHPLLMVVVTRILLPFVMLVGLYIFLRGHNVPGGGFIAGLIVSIGLVMQYVASGFSWVQSRQRLPYHGLIGMGVLAAGITGVGAWFFGAHFLTSSFGHIKLPGIEPIELASAMGFDLGVFLCVVGAVMLALHSISRISRRAHVGASHNCGPDKRPEGGGI